MGLRCRIGLGRFQLAVGEFAERLGGLLLEQALDELAFLAHLAHAVEVFGLDRVAARAFGEIEQRVVDVLEQGADQRIDALERNAANQLQQIAQAIGIGGHALAGLQIDHVRSVVGGGHCEIP